MKKILPPREPKTQPVGDGKKHLAFALRFIHKMTKTKLPQQELIDGMQKMVDAGTVDLLYSICQLANAMVQKGALKPPKRADAPAPSAPSRIILPRR